MTILNKIYNAIMSFLFKKQEAHYNSDSVIRVSELVTNSVVLNNPCDNETFNRVIKDLENITIGCFSTKLQKDYDEYSFRYADRTLEDIENWLIFLKTVYKQKKNELEVINNFLNLLNLTKRII